MSNVIVVSKNIFNVKLESFKWYPNFNSALKYYTIGITEQNFKKNSLDGTSKNFE